MKDLLVTFRDVCPDCMFLNDIPFLDHYPVTRPRRKAKALLKDLGRPGFVGLAETVKDTISELGFQPK